MSKWIKARDKECFFVILHIEISYRTEFPSLKMYLKKDITKPCTHLHPPPLSSFQPPPSSLHHSQQYSNQNNARNWAISPNLGWKIQSCPFWLKIGSHGILEGLIPNTDSYSNPKIYFWANLGPKSQSCWFCLKIDTYGISSMLIFIPTLVFWISNPKFLFGQIWAKKVKVVSF